MERLSAYGYETILALVLLASLVLIAQTAMLCRSIANLPQRRLHVLDNPGAFLRADDHAHPFKRTDFLGRHLCIAARDRNTGRRICARRASNELPGFPIA